MKQPLVTKKVSGSGEEEATSDDNEDIRINIGAVNGKGTNSSKASSNPN